jgi:enoyl-CoA hydratase/carnithine racemase
MFAMESSREGGVQVVRFRAAAVDGGERNRLAEELEELCEEISGDEEVRVVILTGACGYLCMEPTGGDFFAEEREGAVVRALAAPIAGLDRPVIIAISGDAIGLGLEVALACDLRIAGTDSRLGLPHICEGYIPWDGGTQRLARLVGRAKALEMIWEGVEISAREALRIGLVNRIVKPGQVLRTAMELAGKMAEKAPMALRFAKEAVNRGMELTLLQGLRLEADLYFLLQTTGDRVEGVQAFREKRPPRFEGR